MKLFGVSIFENRRKQLLVKSLLTQLGNDVYETRMFHKELCTADHDRNTLNFIEGKK